MPAMTTRTIVGVVGLIVLMTSSCTGSPAPDEASSQTGQPSTSSDGATLSPDQEYGQLVAQCLRDKGWPVEFNPRDRSTSVDYPAAQEEAYLADRAECDAQFSDRLEEPLTSPEDPRWQEQYEFHLNSAECLRQEGYSIPEAPSFEVYVEQYLAGAENAWLPYGFVPAMDEAALLALQEKCPPTPSY